MEAMTVQSWPDRSAWRGRRLILALLVLLVAVPTTVAAFKKRENIVDKDEEIVMGRRAVRAEAPQGPKGGRHLQASEPSSASMERQLLFPLGGTSTVPVKSLKVQAPPAKPDRDPAIEAIRVSLRVCGHL